MKAAKKISLSKIGWADFFYEATELIRNSRVEGLY